MELLGVEARVEDAAKRPPPAGVEKTARRRVEGGARPIVYRK